MIINEKTIVVGTVAMLVLYYFTKSEITSALKSVNPVDDQNIFNRAVNAVTRKMTGDANTSLGSEVYDWFNNSDGSFKWPWQESKPLWSTDEYETKQVEVAQ